jgi:hypothetical protein
MNRWIAKVCLGALFVTACAHAEDIQKLVEVKHVQPTQQLRNLFDVLGVRMSDPVGGYIALKGSKDAVAAAEEVLHRVDVEKPPQDVEITGWLVVAAVSGTPGTQALPEELTSVAKQLKTAFGYADLRLLTSFVLRTRAVSGGSSGGPLDGASYNFSASRVDVTGDTPGVHKLRLTAVHLSCNNSNLLTDVDLNEGQKVVIAKTSMTWGRQTTPLILVLSARVLSE